MPNRSMRQSMRKLLGSALLSAVAMSTAAHAQTKDCNELKREIAAKLVAKGVTAYSLDVVAADAAAEGVVVGRCEGGTQRILYVRGGVKADAAAPASPAAEVPSAQPDAAPAAD